MVTIKVVGRNGRPMSGATVQISCSGWTHSNGRADNAGRVT